MSHYVDMDAAVAYQDDAITSMEMHAHAPYAPSRLKNNDEIRIPVHQQDALTLPSESLLKVAGTLKSTSEGALNTTLMVGNNFFAFLFEEIRYEIGGTEVDRVRNVGITTTMKNVLSIRYSERGTLSSIGWSEDGHSSLTNTTDGKFVAYIPLKRLMGFAEDYRKAIAHVKQELVLLRSATDDAAVVTPAGKHYEIELTAVEWMMPYIRLSLERELAMGRRVYDDQPVDVYFRKWSLYEYPVLPQNREISWTVKSTAQADKPRYVVLGLQTGKKAKTATSANFDMCGLEELKVYLNSVYYPYTNLKGDRSLMYEMFKGFQRSYYQSHTSEPIVNIHDFVGKMPLFVVDCSKQNDSLKSGSVDIRIEFRCDSNIPADTAAYCMMLSDCHLQYTPLSGRVLR